MKKFSTILFAIIFASASSETLRGSQVTIQDDLDSHQQLPGGRQRQLKPGTTCRLYLQEDIESKKEQESVEEWLCMFPEEEASALGIKSVKIDRSSTSFIKDAESGESTITLSSAVIDTEEAKMYIPVDAHVEVRNRRNDGAKIGNLTALVIRVTDANGIHPTATISELENYIFDNEVCLKSQMEACSYGKLNIIPFKGTTETGVVVKHGVVDVQMPDLPVGEADGISEFPARAAAKEQLGDLESDKYDIFLLVLPPGTGDWNSYARGNWTIYNDRQVHSVAIQMHEVGHTFGLNHAGEYTANHDINVYGDTTGLMGNSYGSFTKACYNPANSYQLGWYPEQVKTIDPFNNNQGAVREFTLNGVANYKENKDALIVLRLEQQEEVQDYYIGYNRQIGINEDTYEDKNMVTIVRREANGRSTKVGKLIPKESHIIENFNNETGRNVEIKFVGYSDGNGFFFEEPTRDAVIEVIAPNQPGPTPAPTDACRDSKGKFNVNKHKKKKCKWVRKNKKRCDKTFEGKPLWEHCRKSCKRCDEDMIAV